MAPLEEVADLARADLKPNLEALQVKLKRFREATVHWEQVGQHMEKQTQETVDVLKGELVKIRGFRN